MLRLLDIIEKLLHDGIVTIPISDITNIELNYLKSVLRVEINQPTTPEYTYVIRAFWKFEGN